MKFRCPNCSAKLAAKDSTAGYIRTCPRCKRKITVPELPEPETPLQPRPVDRACSNPARDNSRAMQPQWPAPTIPFTPEKPDDHSGQRRLVWPLDILMYPMSAGGLITLAIVVVLTFLLPLVRLIMFLDLILAVILFIYAGWYLAECVYDSSIGGTRAPTVFTPGLGDMWSRVSYFIAVYVLYLFPPVVYVLITREVGPIFIALTLWTIMFFPMALIAMAVMDSTSALNPLMLLGAIARTFPAYVGMLILLVGVTLVLGFLWSALIGGAPALLGLLVAEIGGFYTAMVQAHVLGRFHWRYHERLDF